MPLNPLQRTFSLLARIGADPSDSEEVRLQKILMVSGYLLGGAPSVTLWGLVYLSLGETLAGGLMLGTALATLILVGLFGLTRRFALFRFWLLALLLLAPFATTAALGGVLNSSAFFLYAQITPLQALMCYSTPRPAFGWLLAYLGLVAALLVLQPLLPPAPLLSPAVVVTFLVLNLTLFSVTFFALMLYFVLQRNLFQALDMQAFVAGRHFHGRRLAFRVGINSGPVVAGVIGRKKFIYDLWGDAVNTASRMESHGSGGAIQIARATYELIQDDFVCEPRGTLNIKGKGEMEVWHVLGIKPAI